MAHGEWRWLLAAIATGGIAAPVAWTVFREATSRRIAVGMLAIVGGGLALAWPSSMAGVSGGPGPVLIALALIVLDLAIYLQYHMYPWVPMFWRLHRMHPGC